MSYIHETSNTHNRTRVKQFNNIRCYNYGHNIRLDNCKYIGNKRLYFSKILSMFMKKIFKM